MGESRIDSQGFSVGRWYVPPFSLGCGACIALSFPPQACVDREGILAALTGAKPVSGLTLRAKITVVELARDSSWWRQWFFPSTPFAWMKKHTALSDDAIATFLLEHHMDRRIPLNRYPGTPRMVLGLLGALARKPGVIVFSTAGLDPFGVREMFQIVAEHLPESSAVYLAWPYFCQGQQYRDVFPGSLSLSVTDKEALPVPAISGVPAARSEGDIAKAPN